ncbi:MAG: hypothetical protein AAF571_06870 [Verrucomicrobiota bacterium]
MHSYLKLINPVSFGKFRSRNIYSIAIAFTLVYLCWLPLRFVVTDNDQQAYETYLAEAATTGLSHFQGMRFVSYLYHFAEPFVPIILVTNLIFLVFAVVATRQALSIGHAFMMGYLLFPALCLSNYMSKESVFTAFALLVCGLHRVIKIKLISPTLWFLLPIAIFTVTVRPHYFPALAMGIALFFIGVRKSIIIIPIALLFAGLGILVFQDAFMSAVDALVDYRQRMYELSTYVWGTRSTIYIDENWVGFSGLIIMTILNLVALVLPIAFDPTIKGVFAQGFSLLFVYHVCYLIRYPQLRVGLLTVLGLSLISIALSPDTGTMLRHLSMCFILTVVLVQYYGPSLRTQVEGSS